ncbi:uncharacterized protein DUF1579 [Eilatimonas milleporae]|uniref:Uncharacterized protein DUF1579 n=1 Tax=Eilatimonas milleporae TaxID=911205 RepID=A0A3M0CNZ4_9PROT|nr:uncharacterized protein DUF1579 [Eilatimonas milleporae]
MIQTLRALAGAFALAGTVIAATLSTAYGADDAGAVPREKMAAFAAMAGTWTTRSRFTPDKGLTWQEGPPETVDVSLRQRGLALYERPRTPDGPGFHVESHLTWDQYRNVYRLAAIDDNWGLMDIYEGMLDGNRLILTNLKSGTGFPTEDGGMLNFRLTYTVDRDMRTMTVEASSDAGANWFDYYHISYERVES